MKRIISSLIVFCLITSILIMPAFAVSAFESSLTYQTTDQGFTLSGTVTEGGAIKHTDRINIVVAKPGADVDAPSPSDIAHMEAVSGLGVNETFVFAFKRTDYGIYNIKVTKTDKTGAKEVAYKKFTSVDPALVRDYVNDFCALTPADDFEAFIDRQLYGMPVITDAQIPEIAALSSLPESFGKMCVYLCDIYEEKFAEEGKEMGITDVVNCLNGAYTLSMMEAGDVTKTETAMAKYKNNIAYIYDVGTNPTNFVKVYVDLKSNITDLETLKETFKWTNVLSYIQDSSRDSVAAAITNNPDLFAEEIAYAESKSVSIEEAAAYISTSKASDYYGGISGFTQIVDDIAEGKTPANPTPSPSPTPSLKPTTDIMGGGLPSTVIPAEPDKTEDKEDPTPTTPVDKEDELPFTDIKNVSWAKDYIIDLYQKGILSGNGDGTFAPDRYVTREEFVKMIVVAFELNMTTTKVTFDDCDVMAWYHPYVQIAASNGIVGGVDKYNFGIKQTIKRQDMAVIISKALSAKKISLYTSSHEFADGEKIAKYAKDAVNKMYASNIISGFEDGTFGPNGGTTRAQAAAIIGRALNLMGGNK